MSRVMRQILNHQGAVKISLVLIGVAVLVLASLILKDGAGETFAAAESVSLIRAGQEVSLISRLSNVVEVTLKADYPNNNLKAGQKIVINISDSAFNGTFQIAEVISQSKFTYPQKAANQAEAAVTGVAGGDYSTLTAWAAGSGGKISSVITAECYNDWAEGLDDNLLISGNTTTQANYLKVTSPVSERHSGKAGTGFKLAPSSGDAITIGDDYTVIENIEIHQGEYGVAISGAKGVKLSGLIIHGGSGGVASSNAQDSFILYNSIIYNTQNAAVLSAGADSIYNVTAYNALNNDCIKVSAQTTVKNTCAFATVLTHQAFSGKPLAASFNAASDTSAPGEDSLQNIIALDNFISLDGGQEDFHLVAGASTLKDKGTDLASIFKTDIDGKRRKSTWDIGADEGTVSLNKAKTGSLASRDATGILRAQDKETELADKRTRNFKTFQLPDTEDGRHQYRIGGSISPVHYRTDPFNEFEGYKEIDLTINATPDKEWNYAVESNGYQVKFWDSRKVKGRSVKYAAKYTRAGKWLMMSPVKLLWENAAGEKQLISKPQDSTAVIDNENYTITWPDAFGKGIDFRYNVDPDHFFKTVIINDRANLPEPTIGAAGLKLTIVMSLSWQAQAKAKNKFAKNITPLDEAPDEAVKETATADETLRNPATFSFQDEANRDVWWLRTPQAWDSSDNGNKIDIEQVITRRGKRVLGSFSVPTAYLNADDTSYPVFLDTAIDEEKIGSANDVAYNGGGTHPGSGNFVINPTYLELGANTSYFYLDGLRYQSIPIPKDATIISGSISFMTYSSYTNNFRVYIAAEDVDSSVAYLDADPFHAPYDGYLNKTTAAYDWNATVAWPSSGWYGGIGQIGTNDVSSVVQELVNRAGWVSGNNISFLLYNYATTLPASSNLREPYSFRYSAANAPKLNCTYMSSGNIFTSKASGDWAAEGQTTWNEAGYPKSGDIVKINSAHTITITGSQASNDIFIYSGGILQLDGSSVASTLTMDNSSVIANAGAFKVASSTNDCTLTSAGTFTFSGIEPDYNGQTLKLGNCNLNLDTILGASEKLEIIADCSVDKVTVNSGGEFRCVTDGVTITGDTSKEIVINSGATLTLNPVNYSSGIIFNNLRYLSINYGTVDINHLTAATTSDQPLLYLYSAFVTNLANSTFTQNYASSGAIAFRISYLPASNFTLTNCVFNASNGNAFSGYFNSTAYSVYGVNCTFNGKDGTLSNEQDIYLDSYCYLYLTDCIFNTQGLGTKGPMITAINKNTTAKTWDIWGATTSSALASGWKGSEIPADYSVTLKNSVFASSAANTAMSPFIQDENITCKSLTIEAGKIWQLNKVVPTTSAVTLSLDGSGGGALTNNGVITLGGLTGIYNAVVTSANAANITATGGSILASNSMLRFNKAAISNMANTGTGFIDGRNSTNGGGNTGNWLWAVDFDDAASGAWNEAATWGKSGSPAVEGTDYPGAGNTVLIDTHTVSVTDNTAKSGSIIIEGAGVLQLDGSSVAATLTMDNASAIANAGAFKVASSTNDCTLTSAGTFSFSGTDIDYNLKALKLGNCDLQLDTSIASGERLEIIADCSVDGMTVNSGGEFRCVTDGVTITGEITRGISIYGKFTLNPASYSSGIMFNNFRQLYVSGGTLDINHLNCTTVSDTHLLVLSNPILTNFTNSTFTQNYPSSYDAACSIASGNMTITNCTFNAPNGAAFFTSNSTGNFYAVNCAFNGNDGTGSYYQQDIFRDSAKAVYLTDCIFNTVGDSSARATVPLIHKNTTAKTWDIWGAMTSSALASGWKGSEIPADYSVSLKKTNYINGTEYSFIQDENITCKSLTIDSARIWQLNKDTPTSAVTLSLDGSASGILTNNGTITHGTLTESNYAQITSSDTANITARRGIVVDNSAYLQFRYANIYGMANTGSATVDASLNCVDQGGNTGNWNFSAANKFDDAASGAWNEAATWGKSGSPAVEGVDYPGPGNFVLIDSNTVSITDALAKAADISIKSGGILQLDGTSAAATLTMDDGGSISNAGVFKVANMTNACTLTSNSGTFIFTGTEPDYNSKTLKLGHCDLQMDTTIGTSEKLEIIADCGVDKITVNSGGEFRCVTDGVTITGNPAKEIYAIAGSTITLNPASYSVGITVNECYQLRASNAAASIKHLTVTSHYSGGTAFYLDNAPAMTIEDCTFNQLGSGTPVAFYLDSLNGVVTMNNCIFNAPSGVGLKSSNSGNFYATNCTFIGKDESTTYNQADIFAWVASKNLYLTDCTFNTVGEYLGSSSSNYPIIHKNTIAKTWDIWYSATSSALAAGWKGSDIPADYSVTLKKANYSHNSGLLDTFIQDENITCKSLTIEAGKTWQMNKTTPTSAVILYLDGSSSGALTNNGTITFGNITPAYLTKITSSDMEMITAAGGSILANTAAVDFRRAAISNMANTGSGTIDAGGCTDAGGNTGNWDFTAPTTFDDAADGAWNAAATWGKSGSPAVEGTDYPGAGHEVIIDSNTVTISDATAKSGNLTIGASGTLKLNSSASNAATLTLSADSLLTNSGVLQVESSGLRCTIKADSGRAHATGTDWDYNGKTLYISGINVYFDTSIGASEKLVMGNSALLGTGTTNLIAGGILEIIADSTVGALTAQGNGTEFRCVTDGVTITGSLSGQIYLVNGALLTLNPTSYSNGITFNNFKDLYVASAAIDINHLTCTSATTDSYFIRLSHCSAVTNLANSTFTRTNGAQTLYLNGATPASITITNCVFKASTGAALMSYYTGILYATNCVFNGGHGNSESTTDFYRKSDNGPVYLTDCTFQTVGSYYDICNTPTLGQFIHKNTIAKTWNIYSSAVSSTLPSGWKGSEIPADYSVNYKRFDYLGYPTLGTFTQDENIACKSLTIETGKTWQMNATTPTGSVALSLDGSSGGALVNSGIIDDGGLSATYTAKIESSDATRIPVSGGTIKADTEYLYFESASISGMNNTGAKYVNAFTDCLNNGSNTGNWLWGVGWISDTEKSWSDTTAWATGTVPAASQSVAFLNTHSGTCNLDVDVQTNAVENTGYTGILNTNNHTVNVEGGFAWATGTFNAGSSALNVKGDVFTSGGTINAGTGTLSLIGAASSTFTPGANTFNHVILNKTGGAGIAIAGSSAQVNGTLSLTDGTLTSGTFAAGGNVNAAGTFDGGAGAITLNSTSIDQTYTILEATALPVETLTVDKSARSATITGSGVLKNIALTAGTLSFAPGYTYSIADGKTVSVTSGSTLNFAGTDLTHLVTLKSSPAGDSRWNLANSGVLNATYADIADSAASPAATAINSVDSGNNTGWTINGILTGASLTHNTSLVSGVTGNITVAFTLQNAIPASGKVVVTFPAGYSLNSDSASSIISTSGFTVAPSGISVSGQAVTLSGVAADAASSCSVTFSQVKNPPDTGLTGNYTLETKKSDDTVLDVTSISGNTITIGGNLTLTNIEPASLVAGAVGNVAVSFTAANPIPADGKILITLPAGFILSSGSSTTAASGTINGTLTVDISGQVATITRSAGTQVSSGAHSLTLTNIKNPAVTGPTGTYILQTVTSSGAASGLIDQDLFVASDTITAGSLSATSVTLVSNYPGQLTEITAALTLANPIAAGGKVALTLDEGFDITAAALVSGNSGATISSLLNNILVLTLGTPVAQGEALSLVFSGIKNPAEGQLGDDYIFQTQTSAGVLIDAGTSSGTTIKGLKITAPNGGEKWEAANTYKITWNYFQVDEVSLYYSVNNGDSWTAIPSGQGLSADSAEFDWEAPASISASAKIKILVPGSSPEISDVSDAVFTIIPDPAINIIHPVGTDIWLMGQTQSLEWSANYSVSATVKIEFSSDGINFSPITESYGTANDGIVASNLPLLVDGTANTALDWVVPDLADASSSCRIRITGTDNHVSPAEDFSVLAEAFNINLAQISLGEISQELIAGDTQTITWTVSGGTADEVKLYYAADYNAGAQTGTWVRIPDEATLVPNNGSYSWVIPEAINSSTVGLKIEDNLRPTQVYDSSDAAFSVRYPTITLNTFPDVAEPQDDDGATTLVKGDSRSITFTTERNFASNLKIECLSGQTVLLSFLASADSFPDANTISWTIPAGAVGEARQIRVADNTRPIYSNLSSSFKVLDTAKYRLLRPQANEEIISRLDQYYYSNAPDNTQGITWLPIGDRAKKAITASVKLEYIKDSVASTIINSTVNDGNYEYWQASFAMKTNDMKIRISGGTNYDTSAITTTSSAFKVRADFNFTAPTASASWYIGSTHNINWTTYGKMTKVDITYFNGAQWLEAVSALSNVDGADSYAGAATAYSWTVPNSDSYRCLSGGKIKITASEPAAAGSIYSESVEINIIEPVLNVSIDLPPSLQWIRGDTHRTSWTYEGALTSSGSLEIAYAAKSASFTPSELADIDWVVITTIASTNNYFDWVLPLEFTGNYAALRVRDTNTINRPNTKGYSQVFQALTSPYITVTAPTAMPSWRTGEDQVIAWTGMLGVNDNALKIEYSLTGTGNWLAVNDAAGSAAVNQPLSGSFTWRIPKEALPAASGTQTVYLKITDTLRTLTPMSPVQVTLRVLPPQISVTVPQATDKWVVDEPETITWTSLGGDGAATFPVKVQYKLSGGSWIDLASTTSNAGGETSYTLNLAPNSVGKNQIRVVESYRSTLTSSSWVPSAEFDIYGKFATVSTPATDLLVNGSYGVSWTTKGAIPGAQIEIYAYTGEFNLDTPATTKKIADGAAGALTSPYSWLNIPDLVSDSVKFRIRDKRMPENTYSYAESNSFRIIPVLGLTTYPGKTANEAYTIASTTNIIWQATGTLANVNLQCSIDGGTSWYDMTLETLDGVTAAANTSPYTYAWTVPDKINSNVKIRIFDPNKPDEVKFVSANSFKIIGSLRLDSPVGLENWVIGTTHPVLWTTLAGTMSNVRLQYTLDGESWTDMERTADASTLTANTGTYDWPIPDLASEQAKVRIFEENNLSNISVCALNFNIISPIITIQQPSSANVGLLSLTVGEAFNINWQTQGINTNNIKIEVSYNGQTSWTTITPQPGGWANGAAGSFSWTPEQTTTNGYVRITEITTNENHPAAMTVAGPFAVLPTPQITLSQPVTGAVYLVGNSYAINWDTVGVVFNNLSLWYTLNGAVATPSWVRITPEGSNIANLKTYAWNIPDLNIYSDYPHAQIKITDETRGTEGLSGEFTLGVPRITIARPVGGEVWAVGDSAALTWSYDGAVRGPLALQYDTGGTISTSSPAIVDPAQTPAGTYTYNWTIPDLAQSPTVKVGIKDSQRTNTKDDSDATFTIIASPTITISSPVDLADGGNYEIENPMQVNWQVRGLSVGNLTLECWDDVNLNNLKDTGEDAYVVTADVSRGASDTADAYSGKYTGSFVWTVPQSVVPSVNMKLKISDAAGHTGYSNGHFRVRGGFAFRSEADRTLAFTSATEWKAKSTHMIRWYNKGDFPEIKIQYATSSDGTTFTDWNSLHSASDWITNERDAQNYTEYSWVVPDPHLANYPTEPPSAYYVKLKITSKADASVYTESPVFKIGYYNITWMVRDYDSLALMDGLTVRSVTPEGLVYWEVAADALGVDPVVANKIYTRRYPYGTLTTYWSKEGYIDRADNDRLISADITITHLLESRLSAQQEYKAWSSFVYDEDTDKLLVNSWLEKKGTLVLGVDEDLGNPSGAYIVIFDDVSGVQTAVTTLTCATADDNGSFWFSAANATVARESGGLGLASGKSYFVKIGIWYRTREYSSGSSFDIGIAKELKEVTETIEGIIAEVKTEVEGVKATVTNAAAVTQSVISNKVAEESAAVKTVVNEKAAEIKAETAKILIATGAESLPTQIEAVKTQVVTEVQPHVKSAILNRESVVKQGAKITIRYRTDTALVPTLSVYSPKDVLLVAGKSMSEIGSTGVYELAVTFLAGWGKGDFTVICSESTKGTVDALVMTVKDSDIEDVSGNVSAIMGNTSGISGLKNVTDTLNTQFAGIDKMLSQISKSTVDQVSKVKGAVSEMDTVFKQLEVMSKQIKSMGGTKGINLEKLYDVSKDKKEDIAYIKNKSEELKATMELNQKLIQSVANKPVVQTWFEFK